LTNFSTCGNLNQGDFMSEEMIKTPEERNAKKIDIFISQYKKLSQDYNSDSHESIINQILNSLDDDGLFPISFLEEMIKIQRSKIDKILNIDIVNLLFDMNQSACKTKDGVSVEIENIINVSQNVSDQEDKWIAEKENELAKNKLIDWLNNNKYGDIIKGKYYLDDSQLNEDLINKLHDDGLSLYRDVSINTASLKSLLKNHIKPKMNDELGIEVPGELPPADTLKVSIFNRAKVKFPKVSKI
jgi:hypothetical protein